MQDIIFDLGAVLIDWNQRHLYRKIFPDEKQREQFLATVCPMSWNSEMDGGKPFAQGCAERIKLFPQYAREIEAYRTRWAEMMGGAMEGTVQILRELKQKGYRVYALSNWSAETFPLAQAKFPFLKEFDGAVVSGYEKCVKPDVRLYQILLSRYHLQAQNCIFTDDNPANIETARRLGFDTILFTTPDELRTQLRARGVL
ncbi:MAG: HAD family phosphatase [Elusimicrobiaceae bacterium]|nr:HAD family phosphatase [Elusimicrobiaceae bacterium]